jgi:hypothetical protein
MVEKSLKRTLRRHHAARLKDNRRFYYGVDLRQKAQGLGMVVATPAPCSCWMCSNRRKYFQERTVQERRWFQHVDEQ